MCSTCGCRNAEEFQAPMTAADDICIACTVESPEYNSNICKKCQEGMGIKKLSQKQAARFMAESFEANDIHNMCLVCYEKPATEGEYQRVVCQDCNINNQGIYRRADCGSCGEDDIYAYELMRCNKCGDSMCSKCPGDKQLCRGCDRGYGAESFEAEGDASKTTSSLNARFFVGVGSDKDLLGKGKFMKYNDAVAKAKQVAEKEGKARVVSTRGLALWTHDGKGLFQAGTTTEEAKKYYRAEDGSVDMDAYANDYMAAEDEMFGEVGGGNDFGQMRAESFEAEYSVDKLSKMSFKEIDRKSGFLGDRLANLGVMDSWSKLSISKRKEILNKIKKQESWLGWEAESFEAESKFDKLSDEIAAQYRKKGKSAAEAKRIGQATAAKIGFAKYGKKGMVAKAKRGRKMSAEGFGSESRIPLAGLTLLALGYFGATKLRKKVTYDCEDCGCKECEEKKAEGYPEVYDPVQDFLPKYRYPKDSVWSNDYNPADPYRALDYQTVHTDSNTKVDRM